MLCCVCKQKEAKVHLTQIADDKVQKVDLCEDCAKAKGVHDPTGFSLADLLLGLGSAQELTSRAEDTELACPRCGFTQADFKKTGRLGCAECYTTFAEGLGGLLQSMHKGVRHVGKTPRALQAKSNLADQIKQLAAKLDEAVAREKFEEAAALRDEIKKLRTQPPGGAAV